MESILILLPFAILFGTFLVLARKPMRFLFFAPVEVVARVTEVEWKLENNDGKEWEYYRCVAEFVVDGKKYCCAFPRSAEPALGSEVLLVYPRGYPRSAIEGGRKAVSGFVRSQLIAMAAIAALLFLMKMSK